ncbi:response regulator [Geomonas anaerohicana]|uniref:histidine kinase n=1 Tax=Geomonas anaerohicana TaxID=2798583 RepID=A0ABS0YI87_9BACT|nr:response regulator [Geomonas anaerohicana]MBJ6752051.1 response regulator [Geomonas anaerohicana]
MNVLIVEDNLNDLKLLRYTMEHHGCGVTEAHDGEEALALAASSRPDIIISDALMPTMDGFQLLRRVKSDPKLAQIPFLFYSAVYTGEAEEQLARSLGAAAFIAKPVEPERLWELVVQVTGPQEPAQAGPPVISEEGERLLLEYSRIVATKLEEKVRELEQALERQHRTEEMLRQREEELATIFDNAPFLMLLIDATGSVRMVNHLTRSFSGAAPGEIEGHRTGEVLRCLNALNSEGGCGFGMACPDCTIRKTIQRTFDTGASCHQVETTLTVTRQGEKQQVTFLISTTLLTQGGAPMVLLSLQDISDYKRIEAQLLHAQKMESIGTFAGGIAHDFNNILTAIVGYGEITLKNLPPDSTLRQNIGHMLTAAQRAAALSKDLLLFSRKQISEKIAADLNDIVLGVQKFLLRVIGEDIVCSFDLARSKLPILADPHQVEQVLMNLATNARDAMPNGGALTFRTARETPGQALILEHGLSKGEYAVLSVEDSGSGMSEETRLKIFDPFFTTKEIGKGTGLGLAVVYGIIKHHNGCIAVESAPGAGTTFRVYLPLNNAALGVQESKLPAGDAEGGDETILVAEDDETVREMVAGILTAVGYSVITARDGEEAVRKYRENRERVRLLLLDVIMPAINGIDAYEEIAAVNPAINAIFATGYANEDVQQRIRLSATVAQIPKPFQPSQLLAQIRLMLDS